MYLTSSLLSLCLAATAIAETIHGVVVFTRHGDRTAKFYSGYQMTNLGSIQVYNSGQYYRRRYIATGAPARIAGIAPDRVDYRQIWASAPDQSVLYQTATNFLQGLYPPLEGINQTLAIETLANGTNTIDPLNGYQFVLVHGEGDSDPDTIWLKGDDSCPAYTTSSKSYTQSVEYRTRLNSTADFYARFRNLLGSIMGADNVTYKNAYDVFDLLNVASIHNQSIAANISSSDLDQLRYLANEWEWNYNYNASQPVRSIGGMTLSGAFLNRLNATTANRNKFQLMAGSYDTFLAFFGLTNLTTAGSNFYGLPNYASSLALELFSESGSAQNPSVFPTASNIKNDLRVRFLFRNGSEPTSELIAYPLFGGSELSLPYGQFVDRLSARAVTSLEQWCQTCGSLEDFCVAVNATSASSPVSTTIGSSGLSNVAAGGIGAGVTLAVVALVGALVFVLLRRKSAASRRTATTTQPAESKQLSDSGSDRA